MRPSAATRAQHWRGAAVQWIARLAVLGTLLLAVLHAIAYSVEAMRTGCRISIETYPDLVFFTSPGADAYRKDERTINDGSWAPIVVPGYSGARDQIANRHDLKKDVNDPNVRGNAAFLDGHAEFIDRGYTWLPQHVTQDD